MSVPKLTSFPIVSRWILYALSVYSVIIVRATRVRYSSGEKFLLSWWQCHLLRLRFSNVHPGRFAIFYFFLPLTFPSTCRMIIMISWNAKSFENSWTSYDRWMHRKLCANSAEKDAMFLYHMAVVCICMFFAAEKFISWVITSFFHFFLSINSARLLLL